MTLIYKILSLAEWKNAEATGVFRGSEVDLKDGYIHLSGGPQVRETAARYFAGQNDLVLVAFDAASFGDTLQWEPSRGGALFPHVYGVLDPALALWSKPLPWTGTTHAFPPEAGI